LFVTGVEGVDGSDGRGSVWGKRFVEFKPFGFDEFKLWWWRIGG